MNLASGLTALLIVFILIDIIHGAKTTVRKTKKVTIRHYDNNDKEVSDDDDGSDDFGGDKDKKGKKPSNDDHSKFGKKKSKLSSDDFAPEKDDSDWNKKSKKKEIMIEETSEYDTEHFSGTLKFDEFDHDAAELFPMGDPKRMMPDNKRKMERYCRFREKRLKVMSTWISIKCGEWAPGVLQAILLPIVLISVSGARVKLDQYCADEDSKKAFILNSKIINKQNSELWRIRKDFVNLLDHAYEGSERIQILNFCCGYYQWHDETMNAIDDDMARIFMQKFADSYHSELCDIFCGPYRKGSPACSSMWKANYPEWRQRQPRNQSYFEPIYRVAFHDLGIKGRVQDILHRFNIPLPVWFDQAFALTGAFGKIPGSEQVGIFIAPQTKIISDTKDESGLYSNKFLAKYIGGKK